MDMSLVAQDKATQTDECDKRLQRAVDGSRKTGNRYNLHLFLIFFFKVFVSLVSKS